MKKVLIATGLVFILLSILLRIVIVITHETPTEFIGFGLTVPLDGGIATFGIVLFVLGLDPKLVSNRVLNFIKIFRKTKNTCPKDKG